MEKTLNSYNKSQWPSIIIDKRSILEHGEHQYILDKKHCYGQPSILQQHLDVLRRTAIMCDICKQVGQQKTGCLLTVKHNQPPLSVISIYISIYILYIYTHLWKLFQNPGMYIILGCKTSVRKISKMWSWLFNKIILIGKNCKSVPQRSISR